MPENIIILMLDIDISIEYFESIDYTFIAN